MKKTIILLAAAALCCSCAVAPQVFTSQKETIRNGKFINLGADITTTSTLADLKVSDKYVSGVWKISKADFDAFKRFDTSKAQEYAVREALESAGADVLVAPQWSWVYDNGLLVEVTVKGYPAKYSNFRTKPEPKPETCTCKTATTDPAIVIYNNKK